MKKIALWVSVCILLLLSHNGAILLGFSKGFKAHSNLMEMSCVQNQYILSVDGLLFGCMFVGVVEQQGNTKKGRQ